jgi:hypothetical protein
LQPDAPITIVKPAHLKFEYRSNPDVDATSPFFLEGFQLVSNEKHVELYLTDKEGKETYLMTSKGIQLPSLKPKDATLAFLQSMKITTRIPEASLYLPPAAAAAGTSFNCHQQRKHPHLRECRPYTHQRHSSPHEDTSIIISNHATRTTNGTISSQQPFK